MKILISGSVAGNSSVLGERVCSINNSANGPFDLLLSHESALAGAETLKTNVGNLKTLCLIDETEADCDSISDSSFKVFNKLSSHIENGLHIVFISKMEKLPKDKLDSFISSLDNKLVDIVISSVHPKEGPDETITSSAETSLDVSRLVYQLKPRYLFILSQKQSFQRQPYCNRNTDTNAIESITRMIALADTPESLSTYVKTNTNKWMHALNLTPAASISTEELARTTPDTTESPFDALFNTKSSVDLNKKEDSTQVGSKRKAAFLSTEMVDRLVQEHEKEVASNQGHLFDANSNNNGIPQGYGISKKRRQQMNAMYQRDDCWFCLASPAADKNLVTSIGTHFYLAQPKGTINAHHVQIIPITHQQSIFESGASEAYLKELSVWREAITKFFLSLDCFVLFCDRKVHLDRAKQTHCFIDAIPLPMSLSPSDFKKTLQNLSLKFSLRFRDIQSFWNNDGDSTPMGFHQFNSFISSLGKGVASKIDYLYIEVPGIIPPCVHFINFDPETLEVVQEKEEIKKIPLQFGRSLGTQLLGCPERENWKNCVLSPPEERELVVEFKKAFKEFEPDFES